MPALPVGWSLDDSGSRDRGVVTAVRRSEFDLRETKQRRRKQCRVGDSCRTPYARRSRGQRATRPGTRSGDGPSMTPRSCVRHCEERVRYRQDCRLSSRDPAAMGAGVTGSVGVEAEYR